MATILENIYIDVVSRIQQDWPYNNLVSFGDLLPKYWGLKEIYYKVKQYCHCLFGLKSPMSPIGDGVYNKKYEPETCPLILTSEGRLINVCTHPISFTGIMGLPVISTDTVQIEQ